MVRFAAGGRSVGLMDVVFREAVGHPHDLVGVHLVRSVLRDHGDGQHVEQPIDVPAPAFPLGIFFPCAPFPGWFRLGCGIVRHGVLDRFGRSRRDGLAVGGSGERIPGIRTGEDALA